MIFNKNKIHLIPQLLQDRANHLLIDSVDIQVRENYADQLEQVKAFCEESLNRYYKSSKVKRHG